MDAEQTGVQRSNQAVAGDRVRQSWHPARQPRQLVHMAEGARPARRAVTLPVVGQELALEPRDVNTHRALGLARTALEAQVQHLANALVAEGPWPYRFLRSRANSIEGGTTEILKNIVAERVLGLPRA